MLSSTKLFPSLLKNSAPKLKYSIKLGDKPLGNLFFDPRVQFFMGKLITVNHDKLFAVKALGKKFTVPIYKFMTDEELEKERSSVKMKAKRLLQIPPIVDPTDDEVEVLSNDSSLDGFEEHHSKIIFTDTSSNLRSYERYIVVREPNGVLRTANKDERFRMNQIFFPKPVREITTPKMFEPKYLQDVLDRGDYEFILDRACVQFNADDKEFHDVLVATYERVNQENAFEKLFETRHFGSLGFYLAINKKINNMLTFFIQKEKLMEASYLVNLFKTVHSISPKDQDTSATEVKELSFEDACQIVKDYITEKSNHASDMESKFDALVLKFKNQKKYEAEIMKTHGVQQTIDSQNEATCSRWVLASAIQGVVKLLEKEEKIWKTGA